MDQFQCLVFLHWLCLYFAGYIILGLCPPSPMFCQIIQHSIELRCRHCARMVFYNKQSTGHMVTQGQRGVKKQHLISFKKRGGMQMELDYSGSLWLWLQERDFMFGISMRSAWQKYMESIEVMVQKEKPWDNMDSRLCGKRGASTPVWWLCG